MPHSPETLHQKRKRLLHKVNEKVFKKTDSHKHENSRMYNSRRWRRARKAFLQDDPLCAKCERDGRTTAASLIDHIWPHKGDYGLFWDDSNWQGLCRRCHDGWKKRIEHRWIRIELTYVQFLDRIEHHLWS